MAPQVIGANHGWPLGDPSDFNGNLGRDRSIGPAFFACNPARPYAQPRYHHVADSPGLPPSCATVSTSRAN